MYIKVRVIAGAKKEIIEKISDDNFKISVKEPAERNLANGRILEIFKKSFPNSSVKIINGHHSPSKMLAIDN